MPVWSSPTASRQGCGWGPPRGVHVEILRLHYAMTLRHWRQRFRAAWHVAVERYGERFCRMWEFYLASAETAFLYENLMVFQLQLTNEQKALPLTREYTHTSEHYLRVRDGRFPPQPVRRARR
jgi:cyclopropane-fatty-acyl-phospholipid synthase